MEKSVPLYVQIPLLLTLCVLFYLTLFVFTSPLDEIPYRLCSIGIFAVFLVRNWGSPFFVVFNLGFLAWNFFWLAMVVWH